MPVISILQIKNVHEAGKRQNIVPVLLLQIQVPLFGSLFQLLLQKIRKKAKLRKKECENLRDRFPDQSRNLLLWTVSLRRRRKYNGTVRVRQSIEEHFPVKLFPVRFLCGHFCYYFFLYSSESFDWISERGITTDEKRYGFRRRDQWGQKTKKKLRQKKEENNVENCNTNFRFHKYF